MNARDLRNTMLGAVLAVSGLSAFAAIDLTIFAPGTPIKSSEVNANFSSLKTAVEAPIIASRLETTGTIADGKVLKLQAGSLAWADDLTGGTGGTAYSAGTGLALAGTTFSVKEAGIDASKIAVPLGLNTTSGDAVLLGSNSNVRGSGLHGRTGAASGVVPGFGAGIWGESSSDSYGVFAYSTSNISLYAQNSGLAAIKGQSNSGQGVLGASLSSSGVQGGSDTGIGVSGTSNFRGVQGSSNAGIGVIGISNARAVIGTQGVISCPGAYAVGGCATNNIGVQGVSQTGTAAYFQGGSGGNGQCSFNGGAGWVCTSDRNKKENFKAVDAQAVLEKLAQMPVTRWNMKGDRNKTTHIGPVAQDFKAAFGLGENDKTINTADAQGVAFAAIKGMYEKNRSLEKQMRMLEARLKALEKAMRSR